jgi:DNA primase
LKILFCFICSDQLSYIVRDPALLGEREKKPKMIFSDEERTTKIELLRYMIVIQMWPNKAEREYALKRITDSMGFDLKEIIQRDISSKRVKVTYT